MLITVELRCLLPRNSDSFIKLYDFSCRKKQNQTQLLFLETFFKNERALKVNLPSQEDYP